MLADRQLLQVERRRKALRTKAVLTGIPFELRIRVKQRVAVQCRTQLEHASFRNTQRLVGRYLRDTFVLVHAFVAEHVQTRQDLSHLPFVDVFRAEAALHDARIGH